MTIKILSPPPAHPGTPFQQGSETGALRGGWGGGAKRGGEGFRDAMLILRPCSSMVVTQREA